ncbi:MAG: hypothetical protein Q7T49_01435 [bacterium]|nr:hypothetical protein [bacterium]
MKNTIIAIVVIVILVVGYLWWSKSATAPAPDTTIPAGDVVPVDAGAAI